MSTSMRQQLEAVQAKTEAVKDEQVAKAQLLLAAKSQHEELTSQSAATATELDELKTSAQNFADETQAAALSRAKTVLSGACTFCTIRPGVTGSTALRIGVWKVACPGADCYCWPMPSLFAGVYASLGEQFADGTSSDGADVRKAIKSAILTALKNAA